MNRPADGERRTEKGEGQNRGLLKSALLRTCLLLSVWVAVILISWTTSSARGFAFQEPVGTTVEQARQLVEEGKWSQAEAAFAELEDKGRLQAVDLDSAVEASRRLNHWDRVIALYKLFPLDAERRMQLYEAYLRAGRQSDAERELRALRSERPDDERLVHLLAFLYLSQQRPAQAVTLYRSFLESHPEAYQSQVNLALVHFSLEETDEAMDRLRKAYGSRPEEANFYFYRQVVRNMSGMSPQDLAQLVADIRRELGLADEGVEAYRILAQEYRNLNRYPPAIACYQVYLQQNADDSRARFELARLHFLQGEDEQASAVLAPLLQSPGADGDQARLFAAELAVKGADFEQAGKLLDELPASFASQGVYQYLSARVALDRGEVEQARELLEEVTRKHPEITDALLHLGQLYMRLGRPDEGRRLLEEFQQRSRQAGR